MPAATLDHHWQDGVGLQVPHPNGESGSIGSNLTVSTSYGLGSGIYGSPENSTTFALDAGKKEVCQPKKATLPTLAQEIAQLERLRSQLEVENRVKDGAENLLNVPTIAVSTLYTHRTTIILLTTFTE